MSWETFDEMLRNMCSLFPNISVDDSTFGEPIARLKRIKSGINVIADIRWMLPIAKDQVILYESSDEVDENYDTLIELMSAVDSLMKKGEELHTQGWDISYNLWLDRELNTKPSKLKDMVQQIAVLLLKIMYQLH